MYLDRDAAQPAWTAERVAARLEDAFRALPGTPVFSTPRGVATSGPGAHHAEALSWPRRFAINPDDSKPLLVRCHCLAMGVSVRERFAALGWARASAERAWRRAAGEIAARLNTG